MGSDVWSPDSPAVWSPGTIDMWPSRGAGPVSSGLKLWLKADAEVATSGANITTWTDQASGVVFTRAGAGTAPQLISSSLNGLPVVRFNNASGSSPTCYFIGSFDPSAWSGMTVIYVARTASSGAIPAYDSVFGWGQQAGTWWTFNLGSAASIGAGWAGPTSAVILGTFASLTNSQVVYQAYQYDKANWTMSGAVSKTIADTSFPTGVLSALIGANTIGNSQSTADLCELLVYDHSLSADNLASNHAYLGRWSV